MPRKLVTGNHVAGHMLAMAGEANRHARGACAGAYPITPQTEVVEYLRAFPFTKGSVVPVESEHSALSAVIAAASTGVANPPNSAVSATTGMSSSHFAPQSAAPASPALNGRAPLSSFGACRMPQ